MSLRAIKEQARRDLHEGMKVSALYLPKWPIPEGEDLVAIPCGVRVHTKFKQVGDLAGTSLGYAQAEDETPKLVFMIEQVNPSNNSVVSIGVAEAYRINHTIPRDGITITAEVIPMIAAERVGLPVPEEE